MIERIRTWIRSLIEKECIVIEVTDEGRNTLLPERTWIDAQITRVRKDLWLSFLGRHPDVRVERSKFALR